MKSRKWVLMSTTMVPMVVAVGVAAGGIALTGGLRVAPALAQCAAKKVNPCNPCAAAKASPCNPCAVKKVAACNPCNPCAAAKANPCNPCAAAKANPCNPCAAAAGNPCNPCAAGGGAVSKACFVPRLQTAARCSPCAAKKTAAAVNPCNPCAAAKTNPCNPCAAAASPCNPCNPCGAAGAVDLTDAEAVQVYDCLIKEMKAAYAKSDNKVAMSYGSWPRYSKRAYTSATHGNRYVQNYANEKGRAYGAYETAGRFPAGTALAKDSFAVTASGQVSVGPLFIMEKMSAGFNAESEDWRYTMIMPNGATFGTTKGQGNANVEFCIGCHMSVTPDQDSTMLLPEEYRVR